MTSSSLTIDKRRRTYVRLLGEIKHALNQALVEEFKARRLTQTQIAETLGWHKSVVSKKLSGVGNMTLQTLADLAYALDRPVHIALPSRHAANVDNLRSETPAPTSGVGPRPAYSVTSVVRSESTTAYASTVAGTPVNMFQQVA